MISVYEICCRKNIEIFIFIFQFHTNNQKIYTKIADKIRLIDWKFHITSLPFFNVERTILYEIESLIKKNLNDKKYSLVFLEFDTNSSFISDALEYKLLDDVTKISCLQI